MQDYYHNEPHYASEIGFYGISAFLNICFFLFYFVGAGEKATFRGVIRNKVKLILFIYSKITNSNGSNTGVGLPESVVFL